VHRPEADGSELEDQKAYETVWASGHVLQQVGVEGAAGGHLRTWLGPVAPGTGSLKDDAPSGDPQMKPDVRYTRATAIEEHPVK